MISSVAPIVPSVRGLGCRLFRGLSPLFAVCALSAPLLAQTTAPAAGDANSTDQSKEQRREQRRANFTPEAMLARLKDQFGVTDDAEWAAISSRITTVMDLRRSMGGGFGGFRGGGDRTSRSSGNPEQDALREAVSDNMPDAEIKARLDRFREVRKQNQAKLEKAQEDLRAVLSVKQEAIATMMGMLP